jgi:hypothetical protein
MAKVVELAVDSLRFTAAGLMARFFVFPMLKKK